MSLHKWNVNIKDFKEDASALLKGTKAPKWIFCIPIRGAKKGQIILDGVEIKAVPYYKLLAKRDILYFLNSTKKLQQQKPRSLIEIKRTRSCKIILDFTRQSGGLLQAVNICNLFVPKDEIIVTTKSKNSVHNHTYKTHEFGRYWNPLAVIVNDRSASASEIVSGALQDLDRAVIVGNEVSEKLVQHTI